MASRVMISPVVVTVVNGRTLYRSKAESYCDRGFVNYFPSNQDGSNASPWVLTLGRAVDWSLAAADAQIEFLFPVPANVDTPDELRTFLRANTVGDLTGPQRTNMQAVFDNHGINRADFTLATTGSQVLQRVASTLFERDASFGMGFRF